MNYAESIEYLEKCAFLGSKKGHDNFRRLLALFDNPQEKLRIIHIAGTNAKGSTAGMLESVLLKQGFRVGRFSSPHLERYNERFCLNGEFISDDELACEVEKVKNGVEKLFVNSEEYFSFFEIVTCVCFNYFARVGVDYLVLEVGLGGRLDATNVIESPFLSIITHIAKDHTEFLGNTIEEIAAEKCGIIKKNCPVLLFFQDRVVYNVTEKFCKEKGSRLFYPEGLDYEIVSEGLEGSCFTAFGREYRLGALGLYQIENCVNVIFAVNCLRELGVEISQSALEKGLEEFKLSGRMELVKKSPVVILDGAHNLHGVDALCVYLKRLRQNNKVISVVGILGDKNYSEMLSLINDSSDYIFLTEVNNKRGISALDMLENSDFLGLEKTEICKDYKEAVDKAVSLARRLDAFVICTGSLYLIADIRKYLKEE